MSDLIFSLFDGYHVDLLRDGIDIAIIVFLLYMLFQALRTSRALAVLMGLGFLLMLYGIAWHLELYTLLWFLKGLFDSLPIVIVVIFYPDIRQMLGDLGAKGLFRGRTVTSGDADEIVAACVEMARQRCGALIVIQHGVPLDDMIRQEGVPVDAKISRRLLMNLFYEGAPLHDGAVILKGGRIAAAACILPLAVAKGQNFGTRHRAAMGITQESDAVAVVVSEERGEISVAMHGELRRRVDAETLRKVLNESLAA